jgi:hypothetical protein
MHHEAVEVDSGETIAARTAEKYYCIERVCSSKANEVSTNGDRPSLCQHRGAKQMLRDALRDPPGRETVIRSQLQVERDFLAGQPAISRLLRGGR